MVRKFLGHLSGVHLIHTAALRRKTNFEHNYVGYEISFPVPQFVYLFYNVMK